MPKHAWDDGFAAGAKGPARCPYPEASAEAWAWSSGRIEGFASVAVTQTKRINSMDTKVAPEVAPEPKSAARVPPPFWAFDHPVAPGYSNGCASGSVAAVALLKHLQSHGDPDAGGFLQRVVLNYADQIATASTDEARMAIRGKVVGMFTLLEVWLIHAVRTGDNSVLEKILDENIRRRLQDAANGVPEEHWRNLAAAEEREVRRLAVSIL